jgi:hypothetical protein
MGSNEMHKATIANFSIDLLIYHNQWVFNTTFKNISVISWLSVLLLFVPLLFMNYSCSFTTHELSHSPVHYKRNSFTRTRNNFLDGEAKVDLLYISI